MQYFYRFAYFRPQLLNRQTCCERRQNTKKESRVKKQTSKLYKQNCNKNTDGNRKTKEEEKKKKKEKEINNL